jgi:hypothetical protein
MRVKRQKIPTHRRKPEAKPTAGRGRALGGDSQRRSRSASITDSRQLEKGRVWRSNMGHDVARHTRAVREGVPQSGARRKAAQSTTNEARHIASRGARSRA